MRRKMYSVKNLWHISQTTLRVSDCKKVKINPYELERCKILKFWLNIVDYHTFLKSSDLPIFHGTANVDGVINVIRHTVGKKSQIDLWSWRVLWKLEHKRLVAMTMTSALKISRWLEWQLYNWMKGRSRQLYYQY